MAGSKRERELARAKYERQQQRRAEKAAKRRRRNQVVAAVVVLAVVVGGITWFALSTRSDDTPADVAASATAAPSDLPTPTESSAAQPTSEDTGQEAVPVDCGPPKETRPDDISFDAAPENALKAGASYDITFATNCGKIVVATDPKAAPETVNSMVFLAEEGYFDLTRCHRLTTAGIYVLQCGDPAGDGTGGPGYSVPDENLPADGENNYPAGTVAMANAGPGTAGSQFFIVYGDTTLPGSYTIWGTVTKGLETVRGIADAGVDGDTDDGPPAQPVVIETATVQRS